MVEIKQTPGAKPKPDYSDTPQKPITLKKDIGGLVGPAGEKEKPVETKAAPQPAASQKKKVTVKKKSVATGQWTIRGVSTTAKEAAIQAAREEGLKLNEWLERAIHQAVSAAPEQQESDKPVQDALDDIRIRLERIELQSGFLYRIWEHLKALMTKPA